MDGLSRSMALDIWNRLADDIEKQYKGRVHISFDYAEYNSYCKHDIVRSRPCTYVSFGLKSIKDKTLLSKDEFVWLTHQLIHEFGHITQRMEKFSQRTADSMLMAKQQAICLNFPKYHHASYYHQFVEIDAERYSWQNTVDILATQYAELFSEDEVKQCLVHGLHRFQGTWYADKRFDTWEEGVQHLQDAFEMAKHRTWDVYDGVTCDGESNQLAVKLELDNTWFYRYLYANGQERNEVLFEYCAKNRAVDVRKFPCLKQEVKSATRMKRRLPKFRKLDDMDKYLQEEDMSL